MLAVMLKKRKPKDNLKDKEMKNEMIEKYDLWLHSKYNLIGQTNTQISYLNTILAEYELSDKTIGDYYFIIDLQPQLFRQLEDKIDAFAINDSNKLTQMRLALVYFIEFIVEQKLMTKIF
jgi:nucleoside-specific outer membrane channel protein Tsx